MGASVQFVGVAEVLRAFDNLECSRWAVFQGKQLNFSHAGSDFEQSRQDLEEWLKMLTKRQSDEEESRYTSQAIYTLKFYEGHTGRITAQTAETSAFNFRLDNPGYTVQTRSRGGYGAELLIDELRTMRDEIKQIREQVAQPQKLSGPDSEQLEPWEKILDHPLVMGLVGKFCGVDMSALMASDGKIAGIPEGADMQQVIDELEKIDPDLLEHLKKLLSIAVNNPGQFKIILGMLDKM